MLLSCRFRDAADITPLRRAAATLPLASQLRRCCYVECLLPLLLARLYGR